MSFQGQALQRCWHLVDAQNQTVGRLANQIATILRGKHKPTFLPHGDMGDYVVVINAEKVKFTSNKMETKLYRWHSGYPGGLKERPAYRMLERNPTALLKRAVLGMIPRNNLRHQCIEPRLKIYVGPKHPHVGQLPPVIISSTTSVDGNDKSTTTTATTIATTTPLCRAPPRRRGYFFHGLYPETNTPILTDKEKREQEERERKW